MVFKDRLKQLRQSKNLTQQQLAESLFISRSMIAKYEAGFAIPTIDVVEAIAKYFHVEISELLDSKNEVGIPFSYYKAFLISHNVLFWVSECINVFFVIFAVVPFFGGKNLIRGALINDSYFVHITIAYCCLSFIANLIWKFVFKTVKSKMIMSLFLDLNMLVVAFMIFYSIVVGLGGIFA